MRSSNKDPNILSKTRLLIKNLKDETGDLYELLTFETIDSEIKLKTIFLNDQNVTSQKYLTINEAVSKFIVSV